MSVVPFDISAEFIPDLLRKPDNRLKELSSEPPPAAPEFDDIVHRCRAMARLIEKARRIAPRSVPVLIEGESGTGKELLARAIHKADLLVFSKIIPNTISILNLDRGGGDGKFCLKLKMQWYIFDFLGDWDFPRKIIFSVVVCDFQGNPL